ncbi:right-handed parallel beta-helix repeat-containing protein [Thermodesulfobacteriota bacterium]
MRRDFTSFVTLFLLLTALPINSFAKKLTGTIAKDTKITEDVEIASDVVVSKGAELSFKKGVTVTFSGGSIEVYGTLRAEGSADARINFVGLKDGNRQLNGIRIVNSQDSESLIKYCNFSLLNTAVLVINSSVLIEKSNFENNKIAIDAKQKDKSVIKDNVIRSCDKVGIFCKSDSNAVIVNNKIADIKKFGIYIHRSGGVKVTDNEIVSCAKGIMVSFVGSDPEISSNKLTSNKMAITIDKGANPKLMHNNILNNRIGINVSKRSDPMIANNDITGNKMGIFVTYSSYPNIEKNNLIDNEHSVYLEFQSAQWEKAKGDSMKRGGKKQGGGKGMKGAFASAGGDAEYIAPKKNYSDKVSATNNFWGDDITEEMENGTRNISAIYDFYDAMEFSEDGKKYKLDSVDFSSWSEMKFENKRVH